jgi:hypothetical protein
MAKAKTSKKSNGAPVPPIEATPAPIVTAEATPVASPIEPKKTAPRPTIVRSEARANLIPINVEEEVRKLAYLLSERRNFQPGHEAEDWLAAENEVRQRYHQQSA